jgi:hypothetical protein
MRPCSPRGSGIFGRLQSSQSIQSLLVLVQSRLCRRTTDGHTIMAEAHRFPTQSPASIPTVRPAGRRHRGCSRDHQRHAQHGRANHRSAMGLGLGHQICRARRGRRHWRRSASGIGAHVHVLEGLPKIFLRMPPSPRFVPANELLHEACTSPPRALHSIVRYLCQIDQIARVRSVACPHSLLEASIAYHLCRCRVILHR